MNSKTIGQTTRRRVYRTPDGAAVSCSLQYQAAYDDYDGQQPGWYGWCGPADDQSDYVLGPYKDRASVFDAYEKRNREHTRATAVTLYRHRAPLFRFDSGSTTGGELTPSRKGWPCLLCHKPIDVDLPVHHCSSCMEK